MRASSPRCKNKLTPSLFIFGLKSHAAVNYQQQRVRIQNMRFDKSDGPVTVQWPKMLREDDVGRRCFCAGVSRSLRCVERSRGPEEDALVCALRARPPEKKTRRCLGKLVMLQQKTHFLIHTSLRHTHI